MCLRAAGHVVMVLLLVSVLGAAQDDNTKCEGTTHDISVCLAKIHRRVNAELDVAYDRALKYVSGADWKPKDVHNLEVAQRRWAAYRDAACDAEYSLWGGGSGGPNAHTACLIRITRQRVVDLKRAYKLDPQP